MHAIIHTPTSNLSDSLSFYEKLQFEVISRENPTLVRGKGVIIEINPDRFARAGVKLYADDWGSIISEFKTSNIGIEVAENYVVNDSTGTHIQVTSGSPPVDLTSEGPETLLGNFAVHKP